MYRPIVSIIIPVYNEEKFIDRCIGSIQSQTYNNLQVIMVNGGSTDGSRAKCEEWARRWNNGPTSNMGIAELINTENNGVSASRNIGLTHAIGELVTFVDGDDWLEPNAVQLMVDGIYQHNADMSGCAFQSRYDQDLELESVYSSSNEVSNQTSVSNELAKQTAVTDEVCSVREFIEGHLLEGDVHCWGRMFKRELIGKLTFKEGLAIGEDVLFLTQYLLSCKTVFCTDNRCYNYYRNPAGAMFRPFTPQAMDQIKCWELIREELAGYDETYREDARLKANALIAAMLTAGRMAIMSKSARKSADNLERIDIIKRSVKSNKCRSSMKLLDRGYKLKIRLFRFSPNLYLSLYHVHKS